MSKLSFENKLKSVIHYLTESKNYSKTALKFGVKSPTIKAYVRQFRNDDVVLKAIKKKEERKNEVANQINKEIDENHNDLIEFARQAAKKVNDLALERMEALIPKEKNLDKLVKVYEATNEILIPKTEDAETNNTQINHIEYIEQMIVKGSKDA